MHLTKQAEQIRAVLDGINPLNAGKKRDKTIVLLHKFFPSTESLEAQLKKYRREFEMSEQANAELKRKATAGERESMAKRMETAQLQSD